MSDWKFLKGCGWVKLGCGIGRCMKKVENHCCKRIKPLLKREVNNEMFFTSLRSYYQIYYYSVLYAACILFFSKNPA